MFRRVVKVNKQMNGFNFQNPQGSKVKEEDYFLSSAQILTFWNMRNNQSVHKLIDYLQNSPSTVQILSKYVKKIAKWLDNFRGETKANKYEICEKDWEKNCEKRMLPWRHYPSRITLTKASILELLLESEPTSIGS